MKKRIAFVLVLSAVLVFSHSPAIYGANADGAYSDPELARAVEFGFGELPSADSAVTYGDYTAMLEKVIEITDQSKVEAWQEKLSKEYFSI